MINVRLKCLIRIICKTVKKAFIVVSTIHSILRDDSRLSVTIITLVLQRMQCSSCQNNSDVLYFPISASNQFH